MQFLRRVHPTILALCAIAATLVVVLGVIFLFPREYSVTGIVQATTEPIIKPVLDKKAYDLRMLALAHVSTTTIATLRHATSSGAYTLSSFTAQSLASSTIKHWPTRAAYPNAGALLPFNRIVAYYGNFYSKGMGILGENDATTTIAKLKSAVHEWELADPSTPVIPAINYIAITAQGSAGKTGLYRAEMPDSQIDKALTMARAVDGIVILDVQVGLSTLQKELPVYSAYFALPNVHLGIDPEFSMKHGIPPGREIGTFNSDDINYAIQFLQKLVQEHNLPPKVLIVHRFTEDMMTGYQHIKPVPEVQVIIDMDGWGFAAKKINTYQTVITSEPVQFTGFKLFYKNDIKPPSTRMLKPDEILELKPAPSFIQYQ
jgi:hypothetical protein